MRRWLIVVAVAVAVLLVLGLWLVPGPQGPASTQSRADTPISQVDVPERAGSRRSGPPQSGNRTKARVRRDALRDEIFEALAESAAHAKPGSSPPAAFGNEPSDDPSSAAPAGQIKDRIGGEEELVGHLNDDFMPLADECIQAALERNPELNGMLAIGVELAGVPELGAVIESVEFPEGNEVEEPELMECIEQSALSTVLPPPNDAGLDKLQLTLVVEPGE